MNDYAQAMAYINKISTRGSVLGLGNMEKLMKELGNPYGRAKIIHIAGTNGKGSVGAFIAAVLEDNGFKTGRYVSPAVMTYLEHFTINGVPISEDLFAECIGKVKNAAERAGVKPTVFEAETAVAFLALCECDYLLLEVGLGGRDDATNIAETTYRSVITSISRDHSAVLGNSMEKIAYSKAGIIKNGGYVVSAAQSDAAARAIEYECIKKNARLETAPKPENVRFENDRLVFDAGGDNNMEISMLGEFQPYNAALAVAVLKSMGIKNFRTGLKKAKWRGRFEIVSKSPIVIADGAHNEDAAKRLRESLEKYFPKSPIYFIMGVLADKDYNRVAQITTPIAKKIYTITPDNPRALENTALAETVKKYNAHVCASNIKTALEQCIKISGAVTVAFGSLSFLGDFIEICEKLTASGRE